MVKVLTFQADGEATIHTWAHLEEPLPPLQELSICFWFKVFFWRTLPPVVSLAVDPINDNALLIGLTSTSLDLVMMGMEDGVFETRFSPMTYRHVCVTVAGKAGLYLGGRLRQEYEPCEWAANRTVEGMLVLGQDQDKPGGGYDEDSSFSGTIIDFHIFARVVSPAEVLAMAQCGAPPSDALVTQGSGWLLNNVSESVIKRQELCSEGTVFFMFQRHVMPRQVAELCNRLQGYAPAADDAAAVVKSLRKYFEDQSDFIKVYIPVNATPANTSEESFMSLRIMWDNGEYFDATLIPTKGEILHYNMVCSIEEGSTLKLLGLTEKMKDVVDRDYFLYFADGKHFLRGVQKSFIKQHNDTKSWCLIRRQDPSSPVLCTHTSSDFPPVGRLYWTGSDNATLRLTLSGCRKGEFTCDSGRCVSLSGRCDSRNNCDDRSDEDNCEVIRVNTEQRVSVTAVPFSSVELQAEMDLSHLPEINLVDNNFVASLWIRLSWTDKRLEFFNLPLNASKAARVSTNKMWKPELVLYPVKTDAHARLMTAEVWRTCDGEASVYDVWEENKFSGDCAVLTLEMLYQETWNCNFLLSKFPFEEVTCHMILDLLADQKWDAGLINVTVRDFTHLPYLVREGEHKSNGSILTLELVFTRQFGGFVVTTFIPIILLILIAFLTFFFETDDFTNRVMVTLSVFIVLASLFSQVSGSLPNTSYIKCIDVFFLCSMFLISLVFACHVVLSLLQRHAQEVTKISVKKSGSLPPRRSLLVSPHHAVQEGKNDPKYYSYAAKRYFRCPAPVPSNKIALLVCCCALLGCLPVLALNCFC